MIIFELAAWAWLIVYLFVELTLWVRLIRPAICFILRIDRVGLGLCIGMFGFAPFLVIGATLYDLPPTWSIIIGLYGSLMAILLGVAKIVQGLSKDR